MNGRTLRPLALFLIAIALGLAGCTGGDSDEYRTYSPVDDGPNVTQPVTNAVPEAETESTDDPAVAVDAASPDDAEDPAAEPVDTADAPAEDTPGTTETPAVATGRPAGTLVNGVTWVNDAERGPVAEFDGVDDRIAISATFIPRQTATTELTWVC